MNFQSVTGKKWVYKNYNNQDINFYKDNFFLDEIVSKLLAIRKIKKEELQNYLNPTIKNILPNPSSLKDMNKSIERTTNAIINNEKIGIFGDYDVDGATSTALLGNFFQEINHKYEVHIPDRKSEGYGPNVEGFKKLYNLGSKLIFTVDCGTLSFKPIEYAKQLNADVVVLDHHQSDIKLPKAYSIINPNRLDDNSELNYLCAAGVCFLFLVALNKKLRETSWYSQNNIKEPNLLNYLDLVSLGTICDVVPLIGLNRAFVKQGLKILKNKKNLGLKTLLDFCKIETSPTPYHIGYIIGPRINAGGRVGKCSHGAELLLSSNPKQSFKIVSELDQFNKERKLLEENLFKKINQQAIKNKSDPVFLLFGDNWHEGVIGIIASKIKEQYNKPTILISVKNDIGKASARSVVGFDIGSVIISAVQEGLLIKGGGHKMAGGFTIDLKKIENFKSFVIKKFKSINIDIEKQKNIYIDSKISASALNIEFYEKVDNLSPFGPGNPEPKFSIENLKTLNSSIVGDNHIKSVLLASDGSNFKTIAFNAVNKTIGSYLLEKRHNPFNIVGKLSLNEWKGKKNVEFIIDDISVNKEIKN